MSKYFVSYTFTAPAPGDTEVDPGNCTVNYNDCVLEITPPPADAAAFEGIREHLRKNIVACGGAPTARICILNIHRLPL